MKTLVKLCLAVLVAIAFSFDRTCEGGRGGGGGGGGGGRGGFGGGGSFHSGGYNGMSHSSEMNFNHSFEMNGEHNFAPSHNESNYFHHSYPEYNNHFGENGSHNYDFNHSGNINVNANHYNFDHANVGNRGYANHGNWYHGNWNGNWNDHGHGDWHHDGWYHHPVAWWTAGFLAGEFAATAPWSWGYWNYCNPYVVEPVVVGSTTIDYSQPIVLADATGVTPESSDGAMAWFDSARKSFYNQDYQAAINADDQALAVTPSDAAMNEFRGLSLFAMKKYKDAAGVIYAVLSVGPGWDWNTMIGLYANADTYTSQFRALEDFVKENPTDAAARFLLAYHYLSCGHNDAAAKQLQEVVKLNQQDTLSAQLLQGLTEKEPVSVSAANPTGANQAAAKPVTAASLTGSWKAGRADGSSIALTLTAEGKYTWAYTQKGKTQEFSGPYTVTDNLLVLKQNKTPTMVGQITTLSDNSFNFKLPGENPSDPGLTFSK